MGVHCHLLSHSIMTESLSLFPLEGNPPWPAVRQVRWARHRAACLEEAQLPESEGPRVQVLPPSTPPTS